MFDLNYFYKNEKKVN